MEGAMHIARRFIGLILILFFGLPTLFGIIWAVGMIKASVSAEFLTDLPRKIIADIPETADEIFREAQSEDYIGDSDTRAWFQAAAKTGISPRELMEKTGLLEWMEGELSDSLKQLGRVLRGERRPRQIVIDLRPLKEAILHPEVELFLEKTLASLPPCDERGVQEWAGFAAAGGRHRELPACQPDPAAAKIVLNEARTRVVNDMDDDFQILEDFHGFSFLPLGLSRTITFLSYFLFLIPAAFILLGALIAASSPAGFCRWSGTSILVAGVPALLLSLFVKYLSLWAIQAAPFASWHDRWASDLGDLVLDKVRWIPERVIDQLFSPVVWVALFVCLVGVVFIAVSFSVRDKASKPQNPAAATSAPVASPKTGVK
jgi:hypothetical protein